MSSRRDTSDIAAARESKRQRTDEGEQDWESRLAACRMQQVRGLHAQGLPIHVDEPRTTLPLYNLHEYAYRPIMPRAHDFDALDIPPDFWREQQRRMQIRQESAARARNAHIEAAAALRANMQPASAHDGVAPSRRDAALHDLLHEGNVATAMRDSHYAVALSDEARARQLMENGLPPFEHELQQRRNAQLLGMTPEHFEQVLQQHEPLLPQQYEQHHGTRVQGRASYEQQEPQQRGSATAVPAVPNQVSSHAPRRLNRTSPNAMRNRHIHISEEPQGTHTFVNVPLHVFVPPRSETARVGADRQPAQHREHRNAHTDRREWHSSPQAIQQEERDFLEAQSQSLVEHARACERKPLTAAVFPKLSHREAQAGFTRSVTANVVCVSCNNQLRGSAWFLRQCGHVYCQACAARDGAARTTRCSAQHCCATSIGVYREVFF